LKSEENQRERAEIPLQILNCVSPLVIFQGKYEYGLCHI